MKSGLGLTAFIMAGILSIFLLLLNWSDIARAGELPYLLASLGGLVCVAVAVRSSRYWLSSFSAYSGFFYLFHCGLLIILAFDLPFEPLNPNDSSWIWSLETAYAAIMYLMGHIAFTVAGCVVVLLRRERGQAAGGVDPRDLDTAGRFGLVLFLFGLTVWIYQTWTSGAAVFGGSYTEFLEATGGGIMPYAYFAISFGLALAGLAHSTVIVRAALLVFVLWALPAFALGLRGEVIIPALLFGVVRARMGRLPFRKRYLMGLVAMLAAGSLVRETRSSGLSASGVTDSNLNPLSGVAELGYTIRPLSLVYQWHAMRAEPYVGPGTYLSPFTRLISGRTFDGHSVSLESDPTVFNYVITERVGPIGGSPVAEAFRAGGMPAVLLVMASIGFLCVLMDRRFSSVLALSAATMFTYVLLVWVRNNVNPIAVSLLLIAMVSVALWAVLVLSRSSSSRGSSGGGTASEVTLSTWAGPPEQGASSRGLDQRGYPPGLPPALNTAGSQKPSWYNHA